MGEGKKIITFQVDAGFRNRIDAEAAARGMSRSEFIRNELARVIYGDDSRSENTDTRGDE